MKTYTYHYPKPSVTTDCIITRNIDGKNEILLIKRLHEPFISQWALPGGFVEIDEDLKDGAERELYEETGLSDIELHQFNTFGKPGRDPRGRTISVVYHGKLADNSVKIKAGDDAAEAEWFEMERLPELAFDHGVIIGAFIKMQNDIRSAEPKSS